MAHSKVRGDILFQLTVASAELYCIALLPAVTLELFPGDNMTHKQDIRMLLPYFGVKVTTNKPESHVPLRRAGPSDVQERLAEVSDCLCGSDGERL